MKFDIIRDLSPKACGGVVACEQYTLILFVVILFLDRTAFLVPNLKISCFLS